MIAVILKDWYSQLTTIRKDFSNPSGQKQEQIEKIQESANPLKNNQLK